MKGQWSFLGSEKPAASCSAAVVVDAAEAVGNLDMVKASRSASLTS